MIFNFKFLSVTIAVDTALLFSVTIKYEIILKNSVDYKKKLPGCKAGSIVLKYNLTLPIRNHCV